jgi:uncharacterized protein YbbK (DUF523 family)
MKSETTRRPRLGISACLLGEPVRYDGGSKPDRLLTGAFGPLVEWVPVCPEVECGLGVPRPAMRLVGDPKSPRLMVIRTGEDLTARMKAWAERRLDELEREDLCGSASPCCRWSRTTGCTTRASATVSSSGSSAGEVK